MDDPRRKNNKLILKVLQNRNMSQDELADFMGVSRGTVSRWLNDHTPLSKAEIFFLESMLPEAPRPTPTSQDPEVNGGDVVIPIYSNIPGNPDFDPKKDKIGELALPAWVVGGNRNDFYVMHIPGSPDLAVVKPKTTYKPGDLAVIKLDHDYGFRKLDDLHVKFELDVKGVAVMILKVT